MLSFCGRIVRGKRDEDFSMLSFLPGRRLAWVTGANGLHAMIAMSDTGRILAIGKSPRWLNEKLTASYRFRLIVLPTTAGRPADWNGLFASIQEHYPEIGQRIGRWERTLREEGLSCGIEPELRTAGVKDHPDHPQHMSLERYQHGDDRLQNARLFLLHSLGANDLYGGTGKTGCATIACDEYLVPNRRLTEFADRAEVDLRPGASDVSQGSWPGSTVSRLRCPLALNAGRWDHARFSMKMRNA